MQSRSVSRQISGSHTPNGTIHTPVALKRLRGTPIGECSPWPLLCKPSSQRADAWHMEEVIRCLHRLAEGQARVEARLPHRGSKDPSGNVTLDQQSVVNEPPLENKSSEPSPIGAPVFPDQNQSMPSALGEALRAIYLKQEGFEKSFETCLDRWHQKVVLDVTENIIGKAYMPGVKLPASKGKGARQNAGSNARGSAKAARYSGPMPEELEDMAALEKQMGKFRSSAEKRNDKIVQQMKKKEDTPKRVSETDNAFSIDSSTHSKMIAEATRPMTDQGMVMLPKSLGGRILYEIVQHPAFDGVCAMMIMLNSVLIGISVQETIKYGQEARWMEWTAHACNSFFLVELLMRMCLQGTRYFLSEEWTWNTFDFALVAFSIADVVMTVTMGQGASSVGSGMKTIKMLRIVRIFRVFRFFRELSLLALMIVDSIKSLCWALLMLTIIIYVFAICFTQACSDYKWAHEKEERTAQAQTDWDTILTQFGSLPRTLYYLVLSMLGGISWGEVSDTLMLMDTSSTFLFFFYVSFTLLAVLNIITGVFVDNAVETARSQRDFLAAKERQMKEKYIMDMAVFFEKMDEDGSGAVTLAEMQKYFSDAKIGHMFAALGIDPGDIERLFLLLDDDGSGEISVTEFLEGCLRLKGEAKSIDVHTCLAVSRRIQKRIEDLFPEGERRLESRALLSQEISDGIRKATA